MEAKFLIFWFIFLLGVPVGIFLAIYYQKFEKFLFFLMVFLTASTFPWMDINFASHEWYRGTTRGFEVTILDLIAIILFGVCLISPRLRKKFTFIPFNFPFMLALIGFGLISVMLSPQKLYGFFELHKWIRGTFIYLVTVNYMRDEEDFRIVINALMAVMFYEAFTAVKQRYLNGMYRAAGTMPHYNTLGSYSNMVIAILLSIMVDYKEKIKKRYTYYGLAVLAGAVCIVLSLSRGAMMALVLSIGFIFMGSFIKTITSRKLITLGTIIVVGLIGLSLSLDTIVDRFINAPESSGESREEYKDAARLMIRDHPYAGVGLNNFSHSSVYYYGPRYGLNEMGTPAHNIYYLTLAEGGIFVLILFLIILLRFIYLGVKIVFQRKQNLMASIVLGISCSFIILALQNWLEYVYRQTPIFFLYNLLAGMIVVAYKIATEKKRDTKPQRPPQAVRRLPPRPWMKNLQKQSR